MAVTVTDSNNNAGSKDQAFFAEEASRQILVRVASVLQDPELCDATFVVEDGGEKEEIRAPTQFMAMSSPYFKSLLYPLSDPQRKVVSGMQPKTFRKILDYLFRGRVPLSSIEDAWKIKVAGRTFQLAELEELCTKFLQYRIDSRNLIHFLKNTSKYNTSDLRDVVITRFLKNADKGFEDEQMLDLTEGEMLDIMSRRPEVQARKIMEVLIKWAKKRYADKKAEEKKVEEQKLEQEKKAEEKRTEEKKAEEERLAKEKKLAEEKEAEEKKAVEDKPKEKDDASKEDSKMDVSKEDENTKEDKKEKEGDKKEDDKSEDKKDESAGDEKKEDSKDDESKMDEDKKGDAKKASGGLFSFFSKGDKTDEKLEKKDDDKKEEENKEDEKKVEEKKTEEKKDEEKKVEGEKVEDKKLEETKGEEKKPEEKKTEEKKSEEKKMDVDKDDDIVEIKQTDDKPQELEEINLISALEKLVKYLKWDQTDAAYYLKEIRGHLIMSQEAQNEALTEMLQSFVDKPSKVTPLQTAEKTTTSKIGPRSATQRGSSPHAPSYSKGQ